MLRPQRFRIVVLGAALGGALLPSLLLAQGRGGAPGRGGPRPGGPAPAGPGRPSPAAPAAPPKPRPRVISFAAESGRWAWLVQAPGHVDLRLGGPDQPSVVAASGSGWSEVALSGGECWVLNPAAGALLRIPAQAGAAPATAASGLSHPGGLRASGGTLYWLEQTGSAAPDSRFLPSAGPAVRLCRREATGQISRLASWPGSQEAPGAGDVVGVTGEAAYIRVRRAVSTEFVRFPLAGGEGIRLATEGARQQGLLLGGTFYWTAPSDEATTDGAILTVRRARPGAEQETVAEWLPGDGHLVDLNGEAYFASRQVYRLAARLAPASIVGQAPGSDLTSDGSRIVLMGDPAAPKVLPITARTKDK